MWYFINIICKHLYEDAIPTLQGERGRSEEERGEIGERGGDDGSGEGRVMP